MPNWFWYALAALVGYMTAAITIIGFLVAWCCCVVAGLADDAIDAAMEGQG